MQDSFILKLAKKFSNQVINSHTTLVASLLTSFLASKLGTLHAGHCGWVGGAIKALAFLLAARCRAHSWKSLIFQINLVLLHSMPFERSLVHAQEWSNVTCRQYSIKKNNFTEDGFLPLWKQNYGALWKGMHLRSLFKATGDIDFVWGLYVLRGVENACKHVSFLNQLGSMASSSVQIFRRIFPDYTLLSRNHFHWKFGPIARSINMKMWFATALPRPSSSSFFDQNVVGFKDNHSVQCALKACHKTSNWSSGVLSCY